MTDPQDTASTSELFELVVDGLNLSGAHTGPGLEALASLRAKVERLEQERDDLRRFLERASTMFIGAQLEANARTAELAEARTALRRNKEVVEAARQLHPDTTRYDAMGRGAAVGVYLLWQPWERFKAALAALTTEEKKDG